MQSEKQQLFHYFINLNQTQYEDVQRELLQNHLKFHPDQLKSVQEIEANRLGFALTLWPLCKVKVSERV